MLDLSKQEFPFVLWLGKNPLPKHDSSLYRVVHRGPARENRLDDVPFSFEKQLGIDMMKKRKWGPPATPESRMEGIHVLVHALGLLLTVDLKKLNPDHPLHCEVNMSVVECRESKGCDCNSPSDPLLY